MAKALGVTVPEWVYLEMEQSRPQTTNRSEWVAELLIRGLKHKRENVEHWVSSHDLYITRLPLSSNI